MSDEQRSEILKRVEKGEITVDEALKLLEDADRQVRAKARQDDLSEARTALSDVLHEVSESLRGAGDAVNHAFTEAGKELRNNQDVRSALTNLFTGIYALGVGHTFEKVHEGTFEEDAIKVVLKGSNGKLRVEIWNEPHYRLATRVTVRAASESEAKALSEEAYTLSVQQGELVLETRPNLRNAGVSASLFLPHNKAYSLFLDTSNGSIYAEGVVGEEMVADTSNGSVTIDSCKFSRARVDTSNGAVSLTGNCGDVLVNTSNGSIRVDGAGAENSNLNLSTSNGSITVVLNEQSDTGYSVEASTSNGRVTADLSGLHVVTKGGNRLTAKSENYDACSMHTIVQARTSNGRIHISHNQ